ncbi:DUF2059 domain-containing protein [Occallatibacter riparius]|uniref:Uncharacterized protein n=1 Tax=Occallatibacter riparius TaxID=1002689 RepID=A0A9J7BTT5_9BACT|nr:hypothetical protein [Occallatibacter riparius]UWZ86001.1 hypothetical protein MOP44_08660 [Occallatibacter riparius]
MKPLFRSLMFLAVLLAAMPVLAQKPMPAEARAAKTIAILNDTKSGEVSAGAQEQLQRWGHFTVVDDADSADIVLRFDKKTDRERSNKQSTDDKGTTTYSGSVTFSSQVHMRAYLKGSDTPFYSTETGDSKKKAGITCVTSFERAWLEGR